MALKIIVAIAMNGVIGQKNRLPFKLADDMKRFREKTVGGVVAMGYNTYESLPDEVRPLPKRENVVLTRDPLKLRGEKVTVVTDFSEILARGKNEDLWILGGAQVYALAIPHASEMHITRVYGQPHGNVHFPEWSFAEWQLTVEGHHDKDDKNEYPFTWEVWKRVKPASL